MFYRRNQQGVDTPVTLHTRFVSTQDPFSVLRGAPISEAPAQFPAAARADQMTRVDEVSGCWQLPTSAFSATAAATTTTITVLLQYYSYRLRKLAGGHEDTRYTCSIHTY